MGSNFDVYSAACFSHLLCVQLLEVPQVEHLFPVDVISRARLLLDQIPGGVGAYR